MIYRKLSSTGDYVLGSGADFLVNSPETVAQAVLTRLKLWVKEWFIDTTDGTDWVDGVLGKQFQGSTPDSVIRSRILGTIGVTEIVSYESAYNGNTRKVKVTATINTIYGTTTVTGTL